MGQKIRTSENSLTRNAPRKIMQITAKTVYEVAGETFPTLEKAEDSIKDKILSKLMKETEKYITPVKYHNLIKLTVFLLDNREEFAELLGYELPENDWD